MRVFEILRSDSVSWSEEELTSRLKKFDWSYEYRIDQKKALRELELIENAVYNLWKANPDKAIKLWNENTPFSSIDKTITPSFIFRLQAQDKN